MIKISQVKLPVSHNTKDLENKIRKVLKLKPSEEFTYEIARQSIDARKKDSLKYVYQILVKIKEESKIVKKVNNNDVMLTDVKTYTYMNLQTPYDGMRPIIVGSGPAGLFCAYYLAKAGLSPIILERGDACEERLKKVEHFWETGELDTESNVQFGEGGAGTFSDGKLNTLVKDHYGRNKEVLRIFVEEGAPQRILYEQKPHLGTDVLIHILKNMRKTIEKMGGTYRFGAKVTDIIVKQNQVTGVCINDSEILESNQVVLALGHSARDTMVHLAKKGFELEPKSFAVGVRMEHPQEMMNFIQYGTKQPDKLGAAPYKVTYKLSGPLTAGRGLYSFCMCPGGYVVNASSEPGRLAVNGMSYSGRDSQNANSAMIVTVHPSDYVSYGKEKSHPALAGMEFQRTLEENAYNLAGGAIPVQLWGDFKANVCSKEFQNVKPCMKGGYDFGNLRNIFPEFINEALIEGIEGINRRMSGFSRPDSLISGVESRTSSPIRMLRDEHMQSNYEGVYPCGEGAGYAGGITSAAMDGLKVGEEIVKSILNNR
ncbi:MAG: FAD-dependent oxidoreductase [Lachnospiraceae bacterium]|nr:FAD-dependent oxidoreductase [Lachnospiraceae bacterium]MDD3615866.1 FAD-dependent oxidoreductase [Lachnospiraceae bacterium]